MWCFFSVGNKSQEQINNKKMEDGNTELCVAFFSLNILAWCSLWNRRRPGLPVVGCLVPIPAWREVVLFRGTPSTLPAKGYPPNKRQTTVTGTSKWSSVYL